MHESAAGSHGVVVNSEGKTTCLDARLGASVALEILYRNLICTPATSI